MPKTMPPWLVLGQLALSSYMAMPGASLRALMTSRQSSMVKPKTLAMTTMSLMRSELGELFCDEGADAHVLEADGVDHAGGGLDDAGRGVAGHGLAGEAFGDEGADVVEGDDVFELDAVAEGSAGGDDGERSSTPATLTRMSGPLVIWRIAHFVAGFPWVGSDN